MTALLRGWRSHRLTLLLGLLALLLTGSQLLSRLDFWLYDGVSRLRPAPASPGNITVIAIDEKSLAQLGRWPWPRAYHAHLLDKLGQAKAVGLDVVLAEPSPTEPEADIQLADSIRRLGKVVGPVFPELHNETLVETWPIPVIARALARLGHTDLERDEDGIVRRSYLQAGLGQPRYPSFAQAVLDVAEQRPDTTAPARPNDKAGFWRRSQQVLVPFHAAPRPYQLVSYADALTLLPPSSFAGRIILIGATATGLGNTYTTPLSSNNRGLSGVEINAYAVAGIASGQLIFPLPPHWKILLSTLLLMLADGLLCRLTPPRHTLLAYTAAGLAALAGSAAALLTLHVWMGSSTIALLLLAAGCIRFACHQSRLLTLATTDGLTGLTNRRHFDERFLASLGEHRKKSASLALMIIDIDNFKGYNDHYGHYAGDLILQQVASELRATFPRKHMLTARLGGEEFGVLLSGHELEAALQAADVFRQRLANLNLPHAVSPLQKVTCSIGVSARVPAPEDDTRSLFETADHALYLAKRNGRNRVSPTPPTLQAD